MLMTLGPPVLWEIQMFAVTAKVAGNVEVQGNAGSKPVIYDLYTGTGTIAQMLSPVASKVIGVEIVAEAVEVAKKNATQNGLTNCEFIADDVLKALDNIEIKPDFIVLDPPRDGIHPKALEKIIDYGVDRMVYISCKPTSLARDLVTLQERGYKVEKCCCVDMFPNTGACGDGCLTFQGNGQQQKSEGGLLSGGYGFI